MKKKEYKNYLKNQKLRREDINIKSIKNGKITSLHKENLCLTCINTENLDGCLRELVGDEDFKFDKSGNIIECIMYNK